MNKSILDNKIIMTAIVAVMSVIIVSALNIRTGGSKNNSNNTNIEQEKNISDDFVVEDYFIENVLFNGKVNYNGEQTDLFLTIKTVIKINDDSDFTYTLKQDGTPIILNKQATLTVDNIIIFNTDGISDYLHLIEELNNSNLSFDNNTKKLIITDKNNNWTLKQI